MATQEQIDQSRQLIEQQNQARQVAVAAAIALVVARVRAFDQWYSTAAITLLCDQIAVSIELIQRNLARQTDAFLAREASLLTGRPVRPVGVIDVATLRQGITHAGAYGRIADTFRYQQSRIEAGETKLRPAIEAAVQRAEEIAEMDTALAIRGQAQKFLEAQAEPTATTATPSPVPKLIGYRRMIHPELSKSGTCGMCIVASHRLYHKAELMPIHFRCNCLPFPVYEGADPGGAINDDDLQRFYAEAGGNQAAELKRTRYQVNEHGELGPVLDRRGAAFRTPGDVAGDERDGE